MPLFGRRRRPALTGGGNPNEIRAVRGPRDSDIAGGAVGSLTAAGYRIRHDDTDKLRRLIQPWQTRAFSYYDRLGEIKYASQFYARMLAPLRLFVEKKDEAGDWVEVTDEPAERAQVDELERIRDPGGGRESLLSSYGRLMFLTGEGYLLCSIDRESGIEQWEFLSTDELRIQSGVYVRYKSPSLNAEEYREVRDEDWQPIEDDQAVAYRLWRRHPRYSELADSTMMGVLDLAEELLLLTLAVRARARSRLASAGILVLADGISYVPAEPVPDEDSDEDPFLRDLTAAMMAPIQNEGAASAVVPLVLRVPDELVEHGVKHIQIVDPTQLYPETGLRRECIERIAIGLDLPPEVLLGMSDANHWTAWLVDEQTWKAHGQPVANQFVNDLNAAYFLPQLRANGVEDWLDYRIAYDASAIINHPDRTKDAKELYALEAISKETLRNAAGFSEDDAMPPNELAERVGIKVRDASLAWYGIPSLRTGGIEPTPGEIVTDAGTAGDGAPATGGEVESGPPADDAPAANEGLVGSATASRIVGAADLALLRAREAAGNRLRSLAKRDAEASLLVVGVAARDVPAALGADRARALGASPQELVACAGDLIRETMRLWGIRDDATIDLVAGRVEQHAARTLFDERPTPLPPQFGAYVHGVVGGR